MQLLLVEDDSTIARELTLRWQQRGWQVRHADCLATARQAVSAETAFDLILLDLGLPDGDGMDLLAQIRGDNRSVPVLVLTARDRVADRVAGLQTGADDYVIKPFAPEELDARIDGLLRRAGSAARQRFGFGTLTWAGDEGQASVDGRPLALPSREFEVLGLLIRHAPRLCPKRLLIETLAQSNLDINDSAAELYVSRLRKQLEGSGVGIRTLRGFGYMLVIEEGDVQGGCDRT